MHMGLQMRIFTKSDLRYYIFSYHIVDFFKKKPNNENFEISFHHHLFDEYMVEIVERILKKKIEKLRLHYEQTDIAYTKIMDAQLYLFDPAKLKKGDLVASWSIDDLEKLVPQRKHRAMRWYRMQSTSYTIDKKRNQIDRQSKSFRANSLEEAIKIGERWLKQLFKRTYKHEDLYDGALFFANLERSYGSLHLWVENPNYEHGKPLPGQSPIPSIPYEDIYKEKKAKRGK